jgi:hypothetical protein
MFYSASPRELEREVRDMLAAAPRIVRADTVVGIVAPHAGYMYSGKTAAMGYAQVVGSGRQVVVVVSPSHREYFDGVSVFPGDAYATPLGTVPVNAQLRDRIITESDVILSTAGHGEEHALEVQLPFLQSALGSFSLIPLVIGDQSSEQCFALGELLGRLLEGTNALLVASSDLSHFHPATIGTRLDAVVARDLEKFDAEQLMNDLESGRAEACGGGPVVTVMVACRKLGATSVRVLQHTHSGEITGDNTSVVGYLTAVIQLPGNGPE